MNRSEAAEEFGKMLLNVGVKETLKVFSEMLHTPGGQRKQQWEEAKRWYEGQSDEGKKHFHFLLKETTIIAAFRLAVNFDGAAGYVFVDEQPAEFAVSLRIYEDFDAADDETPQEEVEICPGQGGEDIHDIFLNLVDEME